MNGWVMRSYYLCACRRRVKMAGCLPSTPYYNDLHIVHSLLPRKQSRLLDSAYTTTTGRSACSRPIIRSWPVWG